MTAKETLQEFLKAWSRKDYTKMYQFCQLTWKDSHSKKDLKNLISVKIKSSKILEAQEVVPTMTDIDLVVTASGESRKLTCRLIKEAAPFKASLSGTWGVNPVSIVRGLYN